MTSLPQSPPGTPPDSLPPISRNTMADEDSSITRKRPRLDDGEQSLRSISAEPQAQGVMDSDPSQPPLPTTGATGSDHTSPPTATNTPPSQILDGTPSKITINVRSSSLTASPEKAASVGTATTPQLRESPTPARMELPEDAARSPSPPTAVGSPYSLGSPPMEVAEPEDLHGHVGPTVWHTSGGEVIQEEVEHVTLSDFPYTSRTYGYSDALEDIAEKLGGELTEQAATINEPVLSEIAIWINKYLRATSHNTAIWYDICSSDRDFWDYLPLVLEYLPRRRLHAGLDHRLLICDDIYGNDGTTSPLREFLLAFAALTARMLNTDLQTLKDTVDDAALAPDLIGTRYALGFYKVIVEDQLFCELLRSFRWKIDEMVLEAVEKLIEGLAEGLDCITQQITLLMERAPPDFEAIRTLGWLLQHIARPYELDNLKTERRLLAGYSDRIMGHLREPLWKLFNEMNTRVLELVCKQNTALTLDNLKGITEQLSTCLQVCVAHFPVDSSGLVSSKHDEVLASLDDFGRAWFVLSSWKMQFLKKCLMQGRMEIRALGVDSMSTHLIHAYQLFIQNQDISLELHPVATFLVHFIQEQKLVEYLVGVESHTQLVSRSKNIVGFLIVAHRYSNHETDTMWNAALTSQDSRLSQAIMLEIAENFNLARPHELLYWCEKVGELSPSQFENQHLRVLCQALNVSVTKHNYRQDVDYTVVPHLYIRLMREVLVDASLTVEKRKEIFDFALSQVKHLALHRLIDETSRKSIYKESFDYISQGSPLSTGSFDVIEFFVDSVSSLEKESEYQMLETEFNMTEIVIMDLSRLASIVHDSKFAIDGHLELLEHRKKLVQRVILKISEPLTPELSRTFWNSLVGPQSPNEACREKGWDALAIAVALYTPKRKRNPFIEDILREHFVQLDPTFFTPSALSFAKSTADYILGLRTGRASDGQTNQEIHPGEIFWSISLKAGSLELGQKAIESLVEVQLKCQQGNPGCDEAMEAHAAFVERAIQSLICASKDVQGVASGSSRSEEDAMVIVATDCDIANARLRFTRSLAILNCFVQRSRSHRSFSPVMSTHSQEEPDVLQGNPRLFKYQPHIGGKTPGIKTLIIGDLSTIHDLVERLKSETGYPELIVISKGQKVDLELHKDTNIRDMDALKESGLLLVQKLPGLKTNKPAKTTSSGLNRAEVEVMKHFDKLYELLGIDVALSEHVYEFLSIFPASERIASIVCDVENPAAIVFPHDAPYKAWYSVYVLHHILTQHLSEGAAPSEILCRATRILIAAIMDLKISGNSDLTDLNTQTCTRYLRCLLMVLKERVPNEVSSAYFDNPSVMMESFGHLVTATIPQDIPDRASLAEHAFATMLEASAHSAIAWGSFKTQCTTHRLLSTLLLECDNVQVRGFIGTSINSFLNAPPPCVIDTLTVSQSEQDAASYFWSLVVELVPEACSRPTKTYEFFDCASTIFMKLREHIRSELPLMSYVNQWSSLLIHHKHNEYVGLPTVDFAILGLACLLDWCIKVMRSLKQPLDFPGNLASDLFNQLLFPLPASEGGRDSFAVLDSATRKYLYEIAAATVNDMQSFGELMDIINRIVPTMDQSQAWTWGYAAVNEDIVYNTAWDIDRMNKLRSFTGYAGMKNLQNTCYMNSLFTQLFMNVKFREFMLQILLSEPNGSQKLLAQTQKLLAYMQNTCLRAVDPDNVTEALITYEGTPIDVSIQMDVDEFYNLLFDRWESQILSNDDKKKFRDFYGGEIVQQIKSKDCPHVSERFETFSAIQCDIQGKPTLADSLTAYVQGEMMEGDNKYSCSTCGSYVNAVKRACFKDLPDSLIFHLKRFDYDLMTGTRSKINDRFEFPEEIDMAPYKVEHLQDPDKPLQSDSFTLVGILVHAGSAEAGHYYSYIRERNNLASWLEFNDDCVSPFDPKTIDQSCFGGWYEQQYNYSMMSFPKTYNAYMLFYERTSSLRAESQAFSQLSPTQPVAVKITESLRNRIESYNAEVLQMFSLFDPEHGKFVRGVLEKYLQVSKDTCSPDHVIEEKLIEFALQHVALVFSRSKDCKFTHVTFDLVLRLMNRCSECCRAFHKWLITQTHEFKMLFLRCPIESVRQRIGSMLVESLRYLRVQDPEAYGLMDSQSASDSDDSLSSDNESTLLVRIVRVLWEFLSMLPLSTRAWDDYFGTLTDIARIGSFECIVLSNAGYLSHCLEVLVLHRHKNLLRHFAHQTPLVRAMERKAFSFRRLLSLLSVMLARADYHGVQIGDGSTVPREDASYLMSDTERQLFVYNERAMTLSFVDEALIANGDNIEACKSIIRSVIRECGGRSATMLQGSLLGGLNITPISATKNFLECVLTFCEYCDSPLEARNILHAYAKEANLAFESGGLEYLNFCRRARDLQNVNWSASQPDYFRNWSLEFLPIIAPHMLIDKDGAVRRGMTYFLDSVLFKREGEPAEDQDDVEKLGRISTCIRRVCEKCIEEVEDQFAKEEPISLHRMDEIAQVMRSLADRLPENIRDDVLARIEESIQGLQRLAGSSSAEVASGLDYDSDEGFSDMSNPHDLT